MLAPHPEADPSRVRLGAVGGGASGGHQIAAQTDRHQQIGNTTDMDVPDFPMAHMKLDAAEAEGANFYAIPLLDDADNQFAEVDGAHARH